MRSKIRTALPYATITVLLTAIFMLLGSSFAEQSQPKEAAEEQSDGNNKCYVCHPFLKTEDIATAHLEMDITCDVCHGSSTEHMHDEMLMTEPDIKIGRAEVQKMCSDPTCHAPAADRTVYGLEDHIDPEEVEAFFEQQQGRIQPNGRTINSDSVCTDCHGTHNLDKSTATPQAEEEKNEDWITAFNGRDLAGWKPAGEASWKVERSRIIATLPAKAKAGELWTEQEYEDYLLAITFQAEWPIQAGIWLRGPDTHHSPRIEISDSVKPAACTGSIFIPGRGSALVNLQEDLVDKEGWNTISVKVKGDRVQLWLNAKEIGAVHTGGPKKGKVGLHIEKHPESKTAEWYIREVLIQPITKAD